MTTEKVKGLVSTLQGTFSIVAGICSLLALCGVAWLQVNFVPRSEFNEYAAKQSTIMERQADSLNAIKTTLAVITEKLNNDVRQDQRLDKIEDRVRRLETH